MEPLINSPVTWKVFEDLSRFLDGSTVTEDVAGVASKAITAWIEQHSAPVPDESPVLLGGFQWKEVFLPAGTQAVTPASLVNQLASTKRNAWKHIWLLLPGECKWQLAESMRS